MKVQDANGKGRKRIAIAICVAIVCIMATAVTYVMSIQQTGNQQNAVHTNENGSSRDANDVKSEGTSRTNNGTNTVTSRNVTNEQQSDGGSPSNETGTTGNASLDKNITDALSLTSACAGSTAAPDQSQADACNFEDASFFANDGDINYQDASDEVQVENIDNMVSLYRRAAQAYVVVPGIKTRTISQVHIVGKVSEDDGMPIYEAKMLCQETRDDGTSGGQWYDVLISVNPDDGKIIAIRETRTDSE